MTTRIRASFKLLLPLILFCQSTFADDTLSVVTTSGIEFKKSREISMEDEDLVLSPAKIGVKYRFKNLSDRTLKETVSFPLPVFSLETP